MDDFQILVKKLKVCHVNLYMLGVNSNNSLENRIVFVYTLTTGKKTQYHRKIRCDKHCKLFAFVFMNLQIQLKSRI